MFITSFYPVRSQRASQGLSFSGSSVSWTCWTNTEDFPSSDDHAADVAQIGINLVGPPVFTLFFSSCVFDLMDHFQQDGVQRTAAALEEAACFIMFFLLRPLGTRDAFVLQNTTNLCVCVYCISVFT